MLTSVQNPLIKQLRKLHRSKYRREAGVLLLEGSHLLEVALARGLRLEVVCATPDWQDRYPHLWTQVLGQCDRPETVAPEVLASLATTVNPDGVVGTLPRWDRPSFPRLPQPLGIALDRLQDPGNLGTIIRTAAAAGASGLWLSEDSVDPEQPKVLRASAGAWFDLPLYQGDLTALMGVWRSGGGQVVATAADAPQTYWQVDFTCPTLIVMGNEGAGLSPKLLVQADQQVAIPMAEGVESLNVAIATALLLYEVQRQRMMG